MLKAIMAGRSSIGDDLVFPSETGTVLDHANIYARHLLPAIEKTGLKHPRIHHLRHTVASQLIHDGASLAYVRDQLGHSSISVTVDRYGHLAPSVNVLWVDRLDLETSQQQNATRAQPEQGPESEDSSEVIEKNGGPGGVEPHDTQLRNSLEFMHHAISTA